MSLERMRAMLRTYTPGRRVRFRPDAQAVRDKVPDGADGGLILKIVPMLPPEAPEGAVQIEVYGLEIEISHAGTIDSVIVGTEDVHLEPSGLEALRETLLRRTVHFPRSSGIGLVFPPGASDYGLIEDVGTRESEDAGFHDTVIHLRFDVDKTENLNGLEVFRAVADFTQCQLLLGQPPAD